MPGCTSQRQFAPVQRIIIAGSHGHVDEAYALPNVYHSVSDVIPKPVE